ncbi:hypothetical protein CHARACLAT_029488 [Characodon lateralis]|uniref:Cystatin domain-containing protein n=1 Tax=Characodon lateralis TaxID=208331 RepID=A0ABU7E7U7_9TELE|nr:hypothetical protein [Characodon lateralis]
MEVKMLLLLTALEVGTAAGRHHGLSMPGSPSNISRNDASLQQVVVNAAHSFNNQSNDAFLFKPSAIHRAQRQVVKGIRYIVDFQISRTVCHKREHIKDLSKCDLQPSGHLHQTFQCHLELWVIPWKHQSEVLEMLCKP